MLHIYMNILKQQLVIIMNQIGQHGQQQQLQQQRKALLKDLHQALAATTAEQDQLAAELVRKLKFFYKLQQELELIEQQLQD